MPRHVTKTYGRNSQKNVVANQAFDDVVKDKDAMMTGKTASTLQRWGNTSFTSTRNTSPQIVLEHEAPNRKRKASPLTIVVEDEEAGFGEDPFSFDSDDEGPSAPKKGMGFKKGKRAATAAEDAAAQRNASPVLLQPKAVLAKPVSDKTSQNLFDVVKKIPVVVNSNPPSKAPSRVSMISVKLPVTLGTSDQNVQSSGSNGKCRERNSTTNSREQLSLDVFINKPASLSKKKSDCHSMLRSVLTSESKTKASRTNISNSKNSSHGASSSTKATATKTVRKFFTSRNSTGSTDDHTYSQSSHSISPQSPPAIDDHTYSQSTLPVAQSQSSQETDNVWESDYDSDWDIESGDPEIVFNSPKKKAAEAQKKIETTNSVSPFALDGDDSESLEDDDSPIVINSEADSHLSTHSNHLGGFSHKGPARTYGPKKNAESPSASSTSSLSRAGSVTGVSPYRGLKSYGSAATVKLTALMDTGQKDKKTSEPVVRRLLTSPKKGENKMKKAMYNPRPWHEFGESSSQEADPAGQKRNTTVGKPCPFDDLDEAPAAIKEKGTLRRTVTCPPRYGAETVSTVRITRDHKPLYTVVRNVKQAHECQEHGETQEFSDDIEYIMEGLTDGQATSTRCLSTLSLVTKCTMTGFRMHLRAHETLNKIFSALHDAYKYPTLALCTAAVMYMMSRDRLNMDLAQSTLELMVKLMSVDSQQQQGELQEDCVTLRDYQRMQQKIQAISHQLKNEGSVKNNKNLELLMEEVTPGHMAMETLLSLTSRRAGDWFKEELRTLGALDRIVITVAECTDNLNEVVIEPTEDMLDKFNKIDRCLRVLENVTYLNADNQSHLTSFKSSLLITSLHSVLRVCENCMPFNTVAEDREGKVDKDCPGYSIFNCLLNILRVLLNLTHDNDAGCARVGQLDGLLRTSLACILRVPQYVPCGERFDLSVLGLGLIINLVEHSEHNRQQLMQTKTCKPFSSLNSLSSSSSVGALEALTMLFNQRCEAARLMEEEHDAELEERERRQDELRNRSRNRNRNHHHHALQNSTEPNSDTQVDSQNKSGEWKESEAGLEWVVMPMDEEDLAEEKNGEEEDEGSSGKEVVVAGGTAVDRYSDDASDDLDIIAGSQDEDENFTKALHKYGKHMEDSIVAAYVALLVGCIVQSDMELASSVRFNLTGCSFENMIRMLKKFLGFMNFTSAAGNTGGGKSIMRVIEILESHDCD